MIGLIYEIGDILDEGIQMLRVIFDAMNHGHDY